METPKKDMEKKVSFNLSPSSINLFYQSPLLFYLQYIQKAPDDTPVPVCYGLSGNIVHDCLQKYALGELNKENVFTHFSQEWMKKNLHIHRDAKGEFLSQEEYIIALIKGLEIVDQHSSHICEESIQFPFKETEDMSIGIRGIIDLQAKHQSTSQEVIIDYKTSNNLSEGKDFERQALFYNYLRVKKGKPIPEKTVFHYLKLGREKVYTFSQEDIEAFEEELNEIAEQIADYGTFIGNYPIGEIDSLFNSKKKACLAEIARRRGSRDEAGFLQTTF